MDDGRRGRVPAIVAAAGLAVSLPASALDTVFDIAIGPRVDELHWSIAGNASGGSPNILSELTWRSVDSVQVGLTFEAVADNGVTFHTRASSGRIHDGRVQDSDYLGDNRTGEISRSAALTDDDDVLDLSLALGRRFPVTATRSTFVTPLVGFSYHEQNLRITDGVQVIDAVGGTAGQPLVGLDSTYQTEWWSAFLGFQIDHRGDQWDTWGRVEYHNADYEAKGNWNLRADLAHPVSFKHKSDGSGPIYEIGTRYRFNDSWAFKASLSWANWDTDSGTDITYAADGSVASTRLNTAQWEHNALMFGISYQYADD